MEFAWSFILITILIWSLWLWRYCIKPYFAKKYLHQQLINQPHYKQIKKTEYLLKNLYKNLNAHKISRAERARLAISEDAYIYGEIEFLSFFKVLKKVRPQSNELFYDLGSGAGKAVLTAACYFKFAGLYGIEKLPRLSLAANKCAQALRKLDQTILPNASLLENIHFLNEDFLTFDFTNGDIIFINATCLDYYAWEKLSAKFLFLKPGSRIIVTTKKITHPVFKIIDQNMELMSWGLNSVNIYEKIN